MGFCDRFPSFFSPDYYGISPRGFFVLVEEHFLLRLLSRYAQVNSLVLGKLYLPSRLKNIQLAKFLPMEVRRIGKP